ncbi:exonuclease domain-containing protein [Roseibaca sp. Y0-43]|uniref:exonuclease domain-containing protein n=1 Tax=Roseibaca sp. Y0-43 TaxID=2816854 RepID=UPI001D0C388F|nr:exonuclease domain-containing protein [Roseibaca sp. Y0-43]MCC1481439.1 exodeoxyribonuclease I [Roseibaca sp. Y0-43]
MGYVFYDTETTGTDTTFDQILQFAAIRTDDDLNELDRFEIRCRLLPHVVPAAGALLATRVTPAMLTDPSLPTHYEAMLTIAQKLREWSPAIFTGYNTLAFDEPLLRQAFYQTLQPIYLTNTNGNQRADVLRLAQVTAALAPNAITVPINHIERPTLKLDMLAPANGFAHENAHDALADVEATIFMARLIRDRAPAVWASLMPLVDKAEVQARVLSGQPLCLVQYHMGRPTVLPVVGGGQSSDNPTMLAVVDLTKDPEPILQMDVDGLVKAMQGPDRAIRIVTSNKMPALVDMSVGPDFGIAAAEIARRASEVAQDGPFAARVRQALAQRYAPWPAAEVVEARIYEGFPSRADEGRMQAFHKATRPERAELVETFEDDRLRELGRRIVFLEQPDALRPELRQGLETWQHNRLHGREGVQAGRTISDAMADLDSIVVTETNAAALHDIRLWLGSQQPQGIERETSQG